MQIVTKVKESLARNRLWSQNWVSHKLEKYFSYSKRADFLLRKSRRDEIFSEFFLVSPGKNLRKKQNQKDAASAGGRLAFKPQSNEIPAWKKLSLA